MPIPNTDVTQGVGNIDLLYSIQNSKNNSSLLTLQNGATALGNGTLIDLDGYSTLLLQTTMTGTATLTFESSQDNVTFSSIIGQNLLIQGSMPTTLTTSGQTRFSVAGFKYFRARISAFTSGTVTVIGYASVGTPFQIPLSYAAGSVDTNSASGNVQVVSNYALNFDGTSWARQGTLQTGADASTGQRQIGAGVFLFNGSTYDRFRGTKVYKYQEYNTLLNAGTFTVWTPTSGKKFRLMGISISSSVAARLLVRDGAGGTVMLYFQVGAADTKVYNLDQGFVSATANNVLEILNSTGGTVDARVTAWGTEE